MIVRNVQRDDLIVALTSVNALFSDNVKWRRSPEFLSNSKGGGQSYRMTLTVKDSGGPGGRRSDSGRRISAACWHAYGSFFDSLPGSAVIVVSGQDPKRPGDPWLDRNMRHRSQPPFYHSWACLCGYDWRPAYGPVEVDNEDK